MTRTVPVLIALGLVAAVIVPYLAFGGASFEPTPVADPCEAREWRNPDDVDEVLEQIVLSALDGTACALGVSREDLVLAVRNEEALDAFALAHDVLITVGFYAWSGFEVTPATVTGFLTILGFSLYDTVVVFDKVRENTRKFELDTTHTYPELANLAVNQTLVRSINTSITALLPVALS